VTQEGTVEQLHAVSEKIAADVSPTSAREVADVLRHASEKREVVVPYGGGTKQHVGFAVEDPRITLRTRHLDQIHHYDSGDLTVGVGGGMALAKLQAILADKGQFLPVDPMLPDSATIGGLLATNSFGPLKAGYGGLRDFCIGIEYATADGLVAKAGGKVVKNVAGYDLMKLLIGSYGTLGVITSANFKVYPKPQQTTTFVADFATLTDAIAYRDRLRTMLRHAYMAMEIISPRAHEYLVDQEVRDPDDYAPSQPVQQITHWSMATRVSASGAVLGRYRRELRTDAIHEIRHDADFWRRMSDFEVRVTATHRNAMALYASAPIAEVESIITAAERVAPEYTMLFAGIGRVTTGNLVLCMMPLAVDPPSAVAFANAVSALRGQVSRNVSIVAARCPEESKLHFDVWGGSPNDRALMKSVRASLDPHAILNRGRYIIR
jgi:glycolate oxidase FAD binding subunit